MTTQQNLTHAYDAAASQWRKKIEGLGYAAAYRWMIAACGVQTHGKTAMDVGCGTGDFSRALIEVAGPPKCLTMLDPSSQMVEAATRSLVHFSSELKQVASSLEEAPTDRHDFILCAHVIEHFDDPSAALVLMRDRLEASGRILLVVSKPHWCNWIIWVRWRHKMIAPRHMLNLCDAADLSCTWDAPFPAGPPSRSSHAYLIKHKEG